MSAASSLDLCFHFACLHCHPRWPYYPNSKTANKGFHPLPVGGHNVSTVRRPIAIGAHCDYHYVSQIQDFHHCQLPVVRTYTFMPVLQSLRWVQCVYSEEANRNWGSLWPPLLKPNKDFHHGVSCLFFGLMLSPLPVIHKHTESEGVACTAPVPQYPVLPK